MSFVLPNGRLNQKDLASFLQTNYGSYSGLSNANTPQARDFLKRLNDLQSVRNGITPGQDGALSSAQQAQVRAAAAGVSEARLAAQRSQMQNDSSATRPGQTGQAGQPANNNQTQPVQAGNNAENDPYKTSGGKSYRSGPSLDDVRTGRSFREGDKGAGVKALQERMIAAGMNLGPKGADGYFGPQTARAAREFFARHKDLNGDFNQRAVERVNGTAEGIRSARGSGIDAR